MSDPTDPQEIYRAGMKPVVQRLTEPALERMRSTAIGGASVSLAIILLLLQTGTKSTALQVSLYAAALGIPPWIIAWQYVETYLFCGRSSHGHFASPAGSGVATGSAACGMVLLLVAVTGLVAHLSPLAAALFCLSAVAAAVLIYRHSQTVQRESEPPEAADEA